MIASFLATTLLTVSLLTAHRAAGCDASTAGPSVIDLLILACAADAVTTAGLSSTFADAKIAGVAAGRVSGIISGSGASNSGS